MSSGQKPRNPRYFPKMKVRGARRRRIAGFQRMMGAFDGLSLAAVDAVASLKELAALSQQIPVTYESLSGISGLVNPPQESSDNR